jgi:hypothetical protein
MLQLSKKKLIAVGVNQGAMAYCFDRINQLWNEIHTNRISSLIAEILLHNFHFYSRLKFQGLFTCTAYVQVINDLL